MINTVPIAGHKIPENIVIINGTSHQLLLIKDIIRMIRYDQKYGTKKISKTMVTKSDITKKQEQLLDELNNCDDELSGQELHRQLMDKGKSMGLTTVYRNLQILIKHGLIRSRHLPNGEVLYTPVDRDMHHLTSVQCGETSKMEGCPVKDIHTPKKNPKKFQLLFHTLEYFGLCQNCYQAQN